MDHENTLPPLVVIVGYNAIGKSDLAISIARRFDGEIISADSRQVYRHLDIGTAKVTEEQQRMVPHHLIDVAEPTEFFTLGEYKRKAMDVIADIHRRGRLPIVVGGTGLYVWAIVDNLLIPACPPDYDLRTEFESMTTNELVTRLQMLDPESASREDVIKNRRRLIRALEVCVKTGSPFSQLRRRGAVKFDSLQIGLTMPFEQLFERIDRRVDLRFELGMIDEVRKLLEIGVSYGRLDSLGLEYREIARYLLGQYKNEAELATHLKQSIHQYTRRQRVWFKKDKRIVWVEVDSELQCKVVRLIDQFLLEHHSKRDSDASR